MAAFGLAGCWNEVHRYAWVTHDACCDAHASSGIDPEDFRRVHLHIAYTLKLCGDASGSRIMLAEAKNSLDATGGRPSEVMNLLWMEAMIRDAPNQQRTKDPGISDLPRHRAGFSLSAILGGLSRMHSDFAGPQGQDPHDAFMRAWQLGIVRRRENDAAGAIEAFDSVIHMIAKGIPTHLERCRFLLDFGGALYQWALENESPNFREKANAAYQMCAHIAAQIGDWVTSARSHLMLARIYISAGLVDRSQTSIAAALDAVGKINDAALRKRIEAFRDALEDLKKKRLDQDGIAG